MILTPAQLARFESFINRNGPVPAHCPELGPCALWTGGIDKGNGYGYFNANNRKIGAHRIALEIATGEGGKRYACHRCDVHHCVNDKHLFWGTPLENTTDMVRKGRARFNAPSPGLPRGDAHWSRRYPEKVKRGEAHHQAVLTNAKVKAIRARFAAGGVHQTEIARAEGISVSTVHLIVKGRIWTHL